MSTTTDGQISYGHLFEDGYEFPWDDETDYDEPEDWWRDVKGFKSSLNPWTKEGDYADGWTREDPRLSAYYDERHKWINENPLPFEQVNVQSCDYPVYQLAVIGTTQTASRGYPTVFSPELLSVNPKDEEIFLKFMSDYLPSEQPELNWLLSSYWG